MKRFFTFAVLTALNITTISAQNEYCIAKIDNNSNIIICNNSRKPFGNPQHLYCILDHLYILLLFSWQKLDTRIPLLVIRGK